MPPAGPGIQSSKPEKVDASLVNIKGHDYYKDEFVPPAEEVTEIDPRDKVRRVCFVDQRQHDSHNFDMHAPLPCWSPPNTTGWLYYNSSSS